MGDILLYVKDIFQISKKPLVIMQYLKIIKLHAIKNF